MSEPIQVLHVVTHMNRGGLETMLMNYYRNIDRSRLQFDFLVHREKRADYDDEIESLGGRIYRLPPLNPFDIKYRKQLQQFFFDHPKYKIVHSHIDCMSAIPLKAAKKAGVPVRIAHSHSISQDKDVKYLLKLFYKGFIAKNATHLMACGQQAGEWMYGKRNFHILNNAIDAKQYSFDHETYCAERAELGVRPDDVLVGHVGRFSPPKNHSFLIDVFAECVKMNSNAKLILVGDGNLRSGIEGKVRALGLEKQVIFTGVRSDVAKLMQAMDVFLFPSVYEGLPLTVVEAQAAGLPCLISDAVPIECKKTSLVQQIALSMGAKAWATAVIKAVNTPRKNTCDEIKKSGYDVVENAQKLQMLYILLQKNPNRTIT